MKDKIIKLFNSNNPEDQLVAFNLLLSDLPEFIEFKKYINIPYEVYHLEHEVFRILHPVANDVWDKLMFSVIDSISKFFFDYKSDYILNGIYIDWDKTIEDKDYLFCKWH